MMGRQEQGVDKSAGRYQVVPRTLCFVLSGDDVLLLKGAPTKGIWPNRYNGVGGHVERDEDIRAAARREIVEETGLEITGLSLRAVINVDAGGPVGIVLFVFIARALNREFTPSPEGKLEWVPRDDILGRDLVEDLPVLLPQVLVRPEHAPPLFGHYRYDAHDRLMVRFDEWI